MGPTTLHQCRVRSSRRRLFGSRHRVCHWVKGPPVSEHCENQENDGLTCELHRLSYDVGTFYRQWVQSYNPTHLRSILSHAWSRIQHRHGGKPIARQTRSVSMSNNMCLTGRQRQSKQQNAKRSAAVFAVKATPGSVAMPTLVQDEFLDCLCTKIQYFLNHYVTTWDTLREVVQHALVHLEPYATPPITTPSTTLMEKRKKKRKHREATILPAVPNMMTDRVTQPLPLEWQYIKDLTSADLEGMEMDRADIHTSVMNIYLAYVICRRKAHQNRIHLAPEVISIPHDLNGDTTAMEVQWHDLNLLPPSLTSRTLILPSGL